MNSLNYNASFSVTAVIISIYYIETDHIAILGRILTSDGSELVDKETTSHWNLNLDDAKSGLLVGKSL